MAGGGVLRLRWTGYRVMRMSNVWIFPGNQGGGFTPTIIPVILNVRPAKLSVVDSVPAVHPSLIQTLQPGRNK